ncbi:MAG: hypothetical protein WBP16_02070 [Ferruginibacter sp.]
MQFPKPIIFLAVAVLFFSATALAQLVVTNGTSVYINPGSTVSVTGNVTNSGTITGLGTTLLNGSSLQTINGTGNISNLTLNNSAGAIITGGAANMQSIYGTLTISAGNLATNGNLTLKSDVNGTARVGSSAGIITGKSIVERYIASPGQRAWHLLSTNTNGGQSIKEAWQENGGPVVAGVGTLITSNLYNGSNGFDMTSTSSSILTHNQGGASGPNWNYNMANTNNTIWSSYPGYMLFVRGDRTYTPTNGPATSPTVLRSEGFLYQGTQPPVFVSATGTGRTLVGNPFASSIDLETILAPVSELTQDFYIWDPALTGNFGEGGFRIVQRNAANNYTATPSLGADDNNLRYIQSGQAFFLYANSTGANVVFDENSKIDTVSVVNPIIDTQGDQQVIVNLMVVNPGNIESLVDGIRLRFDDNYTAAITDDIVKMDNFAENISSFRAGEKLIVEHRRMIVLKDTVFLRITNTAKKDYRLKINSQDFVQTSVLAWLQDTYLNTNTPLDLSGAVKDFNFSVTGDPASANVDRFRIVFSANGPLPVTITSIKANQQNNNIAVEWKVSNQINIKEYEIEKSTDGNNFSKVGIQTATGISGSDVTYNWLDVHAVAGNNFYRVRSIGYAGDVKISQIVKVTMGKSKVGITVYPNPVVNKIISMLFSNMDKGIYQLRLINATGQAIGTQQLKHNGGNGSQTVNLGQHLAAGNYQLEILKPDNSKTVIALQVSQ